MTDKLLNNVFIIVFIQGIEFPIGQRSLNLCLNWMLNVYVFSLECGSLWQLSPGFGLHLNAGKLTALQILYSGEREISKKLCLWKRFCSLLSFESVELRFFRLLCT